jgi:hypothetical protein
MTVTYQQVLAEAGAGAVDTAVAQRVLAEAVIHVDEFIDANLLDTDNPVPTTIEDAAVLRCAVDLFARAKAPFGTQILPDGSASGGFVAQRLGADPLGGVRSLLARWCTPDMGIA